MRYRDFDLLIGEKRPDGYHVRVIQAPAGQTDGILPIDPDAPLARKALARLEKWDTDAAFMKCFGGSLFNKLFTDRIRDMFHHSLGQVRMEGVGLRIRLRIEPPELSSLPWEYLYDEDENFFLATSPEIVISRYIQVARPLMPFLVDFPLRILVVISNPVDLPPLHVDEETNLIQSALEPLMEKKQVELDLLHIATRKRVQSKLQDKEYHAFHFIGHGDFADDRGFLAFVDENGRCHPIDEEDFSDLFLGYRSMRLIILNACKSAETTTEKAFVGMAPQLVRRGVPAVIAMRYSIPDPTAILFSVEFYKPLAKGYPVDTAVSEARRAILLNVGRGERDFGVPVLFMRAEDGKIIDFHSQKEERIIDGTQRGLEKIEELISRMVDERAPREEIATLNEFTDSLFEFAELHHRLLELDGFNKLWRNLVSRFASISDELRRLRIQGLKPVKMNLPGVVDGWDSSKKEGLAPLLASVKTARYINRAGEQQVANLEKASKKIDRAIEDGNMGKLHDFLLEFDSFIHQYRADGEEQLSETIIRLSALSNRLIAKLSQVPSSR